MINIYDMYKHYCEMCPECGQKKWYRNHVAKDAKKHHLEHVQSVHRCSQRTSTWHCLWHCQPHPKANGNTTTKLNLNGGREGQLEHMKCMKWNWHSLVVCQRERRK